MIDPVQTQSQEEKKWHHRYDGPSNDHHDSEALDFQQLPSSTVKQPAVSDIYAGQAIVGAKGHGDQPTDPANAMNPDGPHGIVEPGKSREGLIGQDGGQSRQAPDDQRVEGNDVRADRR